MRINSYESDIVVDGMYQGTADVELVETGISTSSMSGKALDAGMKNDPCPGTSECGHPGTGLMSGAISPDQVPPCARGSTHGDGPVSGG